MIKYLLNRFLIITFFFTASCHSILVVENRIKYADNLVKDSGFVKKNIKTDNFYLSSYQKISNLKNKTLNIYIEGDGFSWKSRYELSRNPTPINPVALKLALKDQADNIIYLARPCQFSDFKIDINCSNEEFWSRARFSNKVIQSTNQAIEDIKQKYGFKTINLFGFSGGGAVAVLVASRRDDVGSIKTVAANLDHDNLTKIHKTTPLNQSLNPINFANKLYKIDQIHIAGFQDKTVPHLIIESFVNKVNNYVKDSNKVACIKIITKADHEYEDWPKVWANIVNKKVTCHN